MRVIESDILKRASLSISNKINFIIVGQWDIRVCNLDDALRLFVYCLQRAIAEIETQINGVVLIMDFKDFTLHQAKHVTLAFLKKFASLIQVLSNNCNFLVDWHFCAHHRTFFLSGAWESTLFTNLAFWKFLYLWFGLSYHRKYATGYVIL